MLSSWLLGVPEGPGHNCRCPRESLSDLYEQEVTAACVGPGGGASPQVRTQSCDFLDWVGDKLLALNQKPRGCYFTVCVCVCLQEFCRLLKTVKVDVDSSGKKCKEKMMKVLMEASRPSSLRCRFSV